MGKINFFSSIKYKLAISIAFSFLILVVLVLCIYYFDISAASREDIIRRNNQLLEWAGKNIENSLLKYRYSMKTFFSDGNLTLKINNTGSENILESTEAENYLQSRLQYTYYLQTDYRQYFTNDVVLYLKKPAVMFVFNPANLNTIRNCSIRKLSFNKTDTFVGFSNVEMNEYYKFNRKDIYLFSPYSNEFTMANEGFLMFSINWNTFSDDFKNLSVQSGGDVYVIDKSGGVIYSNNDNLKTERLQFTKAELTDSAQPYQKTKDCLIFSKPIVTGNAYLSIVLKNSMITGYLKKSQVKILCLSIISMILVFIISYLNALKWTKPIINLSRIMGSIKGHKVNAVFTKSNDEIGILERNFETMMDRIDKHIETEYKLNLEKKNAQLEALQAYINPHFLHNTLQLIGGIAVENNNSQIYSVVKSISDMLRYILKIEKSCVTIGDEAKFIENYLKIQKLRFGEKLKYRIELDTVRCYEILKLCLQPFIENSFHHGFENVEGEWMILVKGWADNDRVVIRISDNGIGFKPDVVRDINRELADDGESDIEYGGGSIGIKNVNARIRNRYGANFGVKIAGNEGKGAEVTLTIPAITDSGRARYV